MTAEMIIIIIISVFNGLLLGFHAGREYENKKLMDVYKTQEKQYKFIYNKELENAFIKSYEEEPGKEPEN